MENWYTEARIREARLIIAPPEEVFAELEKYGASMKSTMFSSDDDLEQSLLARNNPLIDIGLARYARDAKVVAELYRKSRATPADYLQERYLRGLRIACLSNVAMSHGVFGNFAEYVFGAEEYVRLINECDGEYLEALLCNPNSINFILPDLYNNNEPFDSLKDDDRRRLVFLSIHNPRLATICDPEIGNSLREGIFAMLSRAPVTVPWLNVLRELLLQLPPGIHLPYNKKLIKPILDRWENVSDSNILADIIDRFTDLSQEDEFRGLVAAMYGSHGSHNSHEKEGIIGRVDSSDWVLRCAYYGNAELTKSVMKKGFARDKDAYLLAVVCNRSVYYNKTLRKLLESELCGSANRNLMRLYLRQCNWLHYQPVSEWLIRETAVSDSKELTILEQIEKSVAILKNTIKSVQSWIIWGLILLVTLILYKTH